jgi:hypothetical protein
MSEHEARNLASRINGEPGWHAEARHNLWTGLWHVWAWQSDSDEDGESGFLLQYPADWHRLHRSLAEEARAANEPVRLTVGVHDEPTLEDIEQYATSQPGQQPREATTLTHHPVTGEVVDDEVTSAQALWQQAALRQMQEQEHARPQRPKFPAIDLDAQRLRLREMRTAWVEKWRATARARRQGPSVLPTEPTEMTPPDDQSGGSES